MIELTLKEISQILNGQLYSTENQKVWRANHVSLDSRQVTRQTLFFAIVGERFDGHDFALAAVNNGAIATVTERYLVGVAPQIVVADVRKALGQLAYWVRQQCSIKVIAITGSSGKTTIKELTATILRNCGQVLATQGNLNNELGVPLTLLRLDGHDQFAVIELGASRAGDIAYTASLVKPDVVLISNVAVAHLEGFGTITGVAKAKGEILGSLSRSGRAIINLDNCYLDLWQPYLTHQAVWCYAIESSDQADFYTLNLSLTPHGSQFTLVTPKGAVAVHLPLLGKHNVSNAIAAAALAMSQGASLLQIKQGLEQTALTSGRLFPIQLTAHSYLLDDTYNANMGSVTAAIELLSELPGYRILVLGDLAELGPDERHYHQKLGQISQQFGIEALFTIGELSHLASKVHPHGQHFDSKSSLVTKLLAEFNQYPQVNILVKGSRSAKMEEVVQKIQENFKC